MHLDEHQDIFTHRDGDHVGQEHVEHPGAGAGLGAHVEQEESIAGEGGGQQHGGDEEQQPASDNVGIVLRQVRECRGEKRGVNIYRKLREHGYAFAVQVECKQALCM